MLKVGRVAVLSRIHEYAESIWSMKTLYPNKMKGLSAHVLVQLFHCFNISWFPISLTFTIAKSKRQWSILFAFRKKTRLTAFKVFYHRLSLRYLVGNFVDRNHTKRCFFLLSHIKEKVFLSMCENFVIKCVELYWVIRYSQCVIGCR